MANSQESAADLVSALIVVATDYRTTKGIWSTSLYGYIPTSRDIADRIVQLHLCFLHYTTVVRSLILQGDMEGAHELRSAHITTRGKHFTPNNPTA